MTDSSSGGSRRITPAGVAPSGWLELVGATERMTLRRLRAVLAMPPDAALVLVSAHPDDETIGAGRLAHAWARDGGATASLLFSSGEACFRAFGADDAATARTRLEEWSRATDQLKVSLCRRWSLPDGELVHHQDRIAASVMAVVEEWGRPVVIAAPHPQDPHPDHAAVGNAVSAAAALADVPVVFYPVWMAYWLTAADIATLPGTLVTVKTAPGDRAAWHRALDEYASQFQPYAPEVGPVVPADLLAYYPAQPLFLS